MTDMRFWAGTATTRCNGSEILERVWDGETEKTERVESQREDGFATSSLFFPEASVEDARNARGLFADRRGNWIGDNTGQQVEAHAGADVVFEGVGRHVWAQIRLRLAHLQEVKDRHVDIA